MTPLAHRVARELTLPLKRRTFEDDAIAGDHISHLPRLPFLPDGMRDLHCFEITAVADIIEQLGKEYCFETFDKCTSNEILFFLPAEQTWLEWCQSDARFAIHLTNVPAVGMALGRVIIGGGSSFGAYYQFSLALHGSSHFGKFWRSGDPRWSEDEERSILFRTYAALAIINTPKILGRRQHMPNRGLEHRLTRAFRGSKFPLHAWTEIKLEVTAPKWADDGIPEAHLTGARALHFCRAHLRIRLGKLEIVRSHWRGDPSLGIKRSYYTLEDARP